VFDTGMNKPQILASVQARLINLRRALDDIQDTYGWSSGVSTDDLVAAGFSATDAPTLLSSIKDAWAFSQMYTGQQPPSPTYPQISGTPYNFSASAFRVIGPQ
jgi:hypothetical protein